MAQSLAQLAAKVSSLADEFNGADQRARIARVAKLAEADVNSAVRATLKGDQSMSGWTRSDPIEVRGTSRMIGTDEAFVSAGKASGPMRVLQSGRNQGNAGGMAGPGVSADGSTRRNTNGTVRRARRRKGYELGKVGRRWNGRTAGKGTWDDAADRIARATPGRMAKEHRKAIAKHFKGG